MYWRLVIPEANTVVEWGYGPSQHGPIVHATEKVVEGSGVDPRGLPFRFVGASDRLTPGVSAYVVFSGPVNFIGFGLVDDPIGTVPQEVYVFAFR